VLVTSPATGRPRDHRRPGTRHPCPSVSHGCGVLARRIAAFETFSHDARAGREEACRPVPLGRPSLHHNFAGDNCENETSGLDNVSDRFTIGALEALSRCALGGRVPGAGLSLVCSALESR